MTTLADRLNEIIKEQNISKREFAEKLGITPNYVYILTGESRADKKNTNTIFPVLAKLIALDFGYDESRILVGK